MSEKSWVYETKRLRLRPVDSDDAENLMTLNGDPEVMKYIHPVSDKEAVLKSNTSTFFVS